MRCEAVKELLWVYLEKETTVEETEKIEKHLAECADCREELEAQKAIMDSLQSLPEEELPEGYHTELMQKLKAEAAPNVVLFPVKQKKQFRWKQLSLVAAAVLVVVAAGGMDGILGMRESQNAAVKQMTITETAGDAAMIAEDIIVADTEDDMTVEMNDSEMKIMNKKAVPAAGSNSIVTEMQDNQAEFGIEVAAYDTKDAAAMPKAVSAEEESVPFSVTRSAATKATDQVTLFVTDMAVTMAEVQKAIAEAEGFEEAASVEDAVIAIIPVEEYEAFSKALESLGALEWTQKGSVAEGAAWRSVEIQLKIK